MSDWLDASAFAVEAGITRRSATRILGARSWRGHTLEVRETHGRGGRSGLSYEVSLRSLLAALEEALDAPPPPQHHQTRPPRRTASNQGPVIAKRYRAIEPVLAQPPRSPERVQALESQSEATGFSVRTLNRWTEAYDAEGMSGLGNRKPATAGQTRVIVPRAFDTAFRSAGYDEVKLRRIGAVVDQKLKGAWAFRAEVAGWADVGRLVEFDLLKACETEGVTVPAEALRLSRRQVERFSRFRVVNIMKNDRKRFDDMKPRILRDWTAHLPMQCVVADVKHLDVIVTRPDGSTAYPKMVAFYDAGTGRLFVHPVLCPKGESIRAEHVIEAFLAMIEHPEWGFPEQLYLDNGTEFAVLEKLRSPLEQLAAHGARTIIYARPYNASAKPIEACFARSDRYVFSQLPGYAGGERLTAKTQNVGRKPQPYPHPWEHFVQVLQTLVADFNWRPMQGQWGGRSPMQVLQERIAEGWRPLMVNVLAIDSAFCKLETRRLSKGVVKIDGQRYHHPALSALPAQTIVQLALPWRHGAAPLFQAPGADWAYLEPDYAFPANWSDGAAEVARRQAEQRNYVRGLAREAGPYDPVATKVERQGRRAPIALPRPDSFVPASNLVELADAKRIPRGAPAPAFDAAAAERRREEAETERLIRGTVFAKHR